MNCNHEISWVRFRVCPQCNEETPTQTIKDIKEQARKEIIEDVIKTIFKSTKALCPLDCRIIWSEEIRTLVGEKK